MARKKSDATVEDNSVETAIETVNDNSIEDGSIEATLNGDNPNSAENKTEEQPYEIIAQRDISTETDKTTEQIVRALSGGASNTTLEEALANQASAPTLSQEDREAYARHLENAMEDTKLTHEELNDKYGMKLPEAINILRSTLAEAKHPHNDQLVSIINDFERVSKF